ncbi:MAG: putative extracellular protein [Candidatus Jettenia ecosi]|uniref:Putative extracellular protein n=1 Tax=Candidatus Jettenia ecosi TaxID=2494326 RepID=A0A533Q7E2_9BACT|nr:MAG: putative extracellular protein [Candidatus Jettenia ecosi]
MSAGSDQTITLPANASLNGTVSDDGLPNPPGAVTTTWSKITGPGTVAFGNANAVDTTAGFSVAGTYVLRLTANDSELNASDDVTITVLDTTGGGTIDVQVLIGTDDAEESASGNMLLGSSDLEMVSTASGNQKVGMRFTGVNIPKDAAIMNAYIQFKADEIHSGATSLSIQGEAANNAAQFTSVDGNISSRPGTTAAVSWSPAAWLTKGEAGLNQRTPNISSVIQEIVNRAGWSGGNSLVIIITGTGRRVAKSYNGDQAGAPLLHVVFNTGGQTNQPPSVNAGQDQAVTLPAGAALDGSVSDDGLPNPPGVVTTTWSKVSGPGDVNFGNVNAADTTAGFSLAGAYVLRLTADDGGLNASDELSVIVSNTVINQPPTVNAGIDQSITLPSSATLDGTVADDGLPNPPGAVTTAWSKVSGPGAVTFGNANAVDTTAGFSAAGTYVLRLTANDSELNASDDVTITVLDTTGGGTIDVQVLIGTDDAEESASGNMLLGSSDLEMVSTASGNQKVGMRFTGVNIPKDAAIMNAYIQFKADEIHSGATSLSIQGETVNSAAPFTSTKGNISSRPGTTAAVPWSPAAWLIKKEVGLNQRTPNISSVIQEIVNRAGWSGGNSLVIIITGAGRRVAKSYNGDQAGAPLLHIAYSVGQTNQPPTVNAGQDQAVTLPASAALDGSVSDDGLPNPPGAVITTWSKVSGPGDVAFDNANAVDTTASFLVAGTYVLRLTADDGALITSDELSIVVSNPIINQPPEVDAGIDQAITLPNSATLDGTVTDDGLPTGTITTTWSMVSGTGTVSFGDANAVDTTASFSLAGTYVLSLVADDGELNPSDEITIVVSNPIVNQPPEVDAGVDQSITLPNSATLDGTVTDDGLPTGTITTTWSMVSGTGTVNFDNAGAVDTTASFSEAGTYVLSLTADDGELNPSDEITIVVSNPIVNQPPEVDAGIDQSITLPNSATLDGTVTDDGLPTGTITTSWNVVSGTGTVNFDNAGAVDTTASFSEAGTYVLSLAANDSNLSSNDEVTIVVSD